MRITVTVEDDVRAGINALRKDRGATKEIVNEALRWGLSRGMRSGRPKPSRARKAKVSNS